MLASMVSRHLASYLLAQVSIRTLDSFSLPRVDVMKIDVEGHASRVLAGGAETIQKHRCMLIVSPPLPCKLKSNKRGAHQK